MSDYAEFLSSKAAVDVASGAEPGVLHEILFPFQRDITAWAIRRGRAAIFADCGMGKTFMQLEWARQWDPPVLVVAPLAVTHQTIGEAARLGIDVTYCTEPTDAPLQITNYQRLASFAGYPYAAIVLDESSILKSLNGQTRKLILDEFAAIPNRLACTATPSPNDLTELGNHAQFLGVMSYREMSATFFVKDSNSMAWRLKGHARDAFFRWLASWAVYVRKPSDLGYDDDGFVLPPLDIREIAVRTNNKPAGRLFPGMDPGLRGRIRARKSTESARVAVLAGEIKNSTEQWIVWCGLNTEGRLLHGALNGQSVLVEGSHSEEEKVARAALWLSGQRRVMITKPSIYGFGMNFQHCHHMAFLGLGDSYEQYYQSIRRCWRFGQPSPVDVAIVTSDIEAEVVDNVKRKEAQAEGAARSVADAVRESEMENVRGMERSRTAYVTAKSSGNAWTMHLGDSAEVLGQVADSSVGLSVFSPPFVSLYTYTATERDMGNCKDEEQFFEQFRFIIDELLRATMPGRNCCVHVSQVPAMLVRDGYIGMKDFRARCVAEFSARGWIYHGECVIDKDPQAQAIRSKSKGLLFVQLEKDSAWLRPALADYILVFRKPGENARPIKPDITRDEWIQWARPIWYGISETDTLNYRDARTDNDERHICPLQLGTIERCVRLWSNENDMILSPFAGIGSEGFVAVRHGRLFTGIELKQEYYELAVKNLEAAERERPRLF